MIAYGSTLTGTIVFGDSGTGWPPSAWNVSQGHYRVTWSDAHVLSAVRDWQVIDGLSRDAAIREFASQYWLSRATGLLESILLGLSAPLARDVLKLIEELLSSSKVAGDAVVDEILKAPLALK